MTEEKIEGKTANEWFALGYEEKDPEKKVKYYSKCLELDPKHDAAWFNKGNALRKLGKNEEVIGGYDNFRNRP